MTRGNFRSGRGGLMGNVVLSRSGSPRGTLGRKSGFLLRRCSCSHTFLFFSAVLGRCGGSSTSSVLRKHRSRTGVGARGPTGGVHLCLGLGEEVFGTPPPRTRTHVSPGARARTGPRPRERPGRVWRGTPALELSGRRCSVRAGVQEPRARPRLQPDRRKARAGGGGGGGGKARL